MTRTEITGGFWAERLRLNRERAIPHGFEQLQRHGALNNLRLAAGGEGRYEAQSDTAGFAFPFLDSDVYKWLEAVGWELGRAPDAGIAAAADEAIAVVAAAQHADGYVNSFVDVVRGGARYSDLAWGHEFYCLGHLIQAAVAWHRSLGDNRLLAIATRAADRLDEDFGPQGKAGVDGHPIVESALVELSRVTGDRRYALLSERMISLRGTGIIGPGRFGAEYWQDHEPVRTAKSVAGHAVRQLYLDAGVVDAAVELGDKELLASAEHRWHDLMRTRTYLTGGMGSRHRDEAFGDAYELPPDRAYTETCAAIASVMLAWRLLQATGDSGYADAIERAMFNGVLSGLSLGGTEFFYTNPLQRRTHRASEQRGHSDRQPWYPCACCPPNLMRLLSSWERYIATPDAGGIRIHQFATASIAANGVRMRMETNYPWDGRVTVHIDETPAEPWTLSLRVPRWSRAAKLTGPDGASESVAPGQAVLTRQWQAGDSIVLDLDVSVRVTEPHPRVDAVRGCVAVERGPLVYCLETADIPAQTELEDLEWDRTRQPAEKPRPDVAEHIIGVDVPVLQRGSAEPATAGAIPYYAWANRGDGGMRVWIPLQAVPLSHG